MTLEISIERTDHLKDVGLQNLPNDWSIVEIKDLLEKDRGISVGVMYPGTHDPHGIPLIKVGDLTRNTISKNLEFYISPEKHYEYRRTALEGGELLLTLVGALGHCAIAPDSMAGWNVARAIAVLRLKKDIDANFVRLCLLSPPLQHLINTWANTSVQATINLKEVKQLPIPYPPSKERKNIVQFITCMEQKIENLRRQNETLEQIAQILFKYWFIDFEFPNADGKPYKSSGGAMFASELGDIPEGWRVGKLKDISDITSSKRIFSAEYVESGIPFYRSKEIIELHAGQNVTTELYISEEKFNGIKSKFEVPKADEILLTSVGTIGVPYLIKKSDQFYFKDGNLTWIKRFKNGFSGVVVYYWLKSDSTQAKIKQNTIGSTQKALTIQALGNILIFIPDTITLSGYTEFIKIVNSKIENNIYQIQTLTKTRDSLLPKLMSGQLRIKEK